MERILRVYRSALYSFKGLFSFLSPRIYIPVKVINPVFQVLFFALIASHAYENSHIYEGIHNSYSGKILPYIIGNAFLLCSTNAFFGVGAVLIGEREIGTLKLFIAAPYNKLTLLASKTLFYILDGTITVVIGLITGMVFFNLRIPGEKISFFILILVVVTFSACAMGLFISSIGLVTRDINLLLNLSSMLLMAFSGVNFPVEDLPYGLRMVSEFLPLTNGLWAVRVLLGMEEGEGTSIALLTFREFVLGIGFCFAAFLTVNIMEKLARKNATVDLF